MPLQPPKLDDRDFKSLFEEVRSRIPRYLPEWTDWNESDPGITLLQLQAWLSETILYRLNKLPELNYLKFLQLLGIEQTPAKPAQADLTFILKEDLETDANIADVLIPKGTVVGSSARDLPQPVNFETERTLRAITARLELVLTHDGTDDDEAVKDITQDNNNSGRSFAPFGTPATTGASMILAFKSKQPFPRKEVGLQIYLTEKGQDLLDAPAISDCGPSVESVGGPQLAWEWWDGQAWDSLNVKETDDGTRALSRNGQVYFQVPGQIPQTKYSSLGLPLFQEDEDDPPLYYWMRVRFVGGDYVTGPDIDRVVTNTVQAAAALTARDEVVGSSSGTPNQIMTLRYSPVLADPPLELEVDEGQGPKPWELTSDFHASGPQDEHFILNRSSGEIIFGDGLHGRIPLAGQANVVARSYRYGGGRTGNVGQETVTDMVTSNPDVEEVTNYRPAIGGEDEEPLESTKVTGPRELFKTRDRAVTLEDFAELAMATPGALVARAAAHASQDSGDGSSIINVVIVPQSRDSRPVPSAGSRELVCRYLDQRRLITSQVRVMGPLYHDLSVLINVRTKDDADLLEVKEAISDRLAKYFHPLEGGLDRQGWQFGRNVYYSEVLHEVMSVEGVLLVENLELLKLLPRTDIDTRPYFEVDESLLGAQDDLIQAEINKFPDMAEGCVPEARTITVSAVEIGREGEEDATELRTYVVAAYSCCDMPVEDGALLALVQPLDLTVNYLRGGP
ncbi:MAG: putative baseplate assembly protein [Chloroflexi bacterium]|nr:putative baseplate assembly protein [Chloroflexota bacterium]